VNHAAKTLNDLYGNTLNGLIKGGGIRLSYSKNPLGVRTPTSANGSGPSLQQQQTFHQGHSGSSYPPDDRRRGGNGGLGSLASPPPSATQFLPVTSQPPRFFSSSPSMPAFAPNSNSSLSNADAYVPRNVGGNGYGYSLAPIASSSSMNTPSVSSFAPFGMPSNQSTHSMIPEQKESDHYNSHHNITRTLSPPVHNLEAARAG
jgi:hypothetical protein